MIILEGNVYSQICQVVTWAVFSILFYRFGRMLAVHIWACAIGTGPDFKKAGSWAVVTGCTDGIGKAYAEQLAARGLNIVLLSRTLSKLEELAKQIEEKFKVSTLVIAVDFSHSDIYDEIESKLDGLDIGVLVNNVGITDDHPEYFEGMDSPMTHIVLGQMKGKGDGYIINIGSLAGACPAPLLTLYSGTKGFVDLFSRSLHAECKSFGIHVQSVRPMFVATKKSGIRNPNIFAPSPATFVKNALNTVVLAPVTTGYWAHSIQATIWPLIPDYFVKVLIFLPARTLGRKKKEAAAAGKTD